MSLASLRWQALCGVALGLVAAPVVGADPPANGPAPSPPASTPLAASLSPSCFRASVLVTVDGSTGSGTVIDPRGYVLTNHHVVQPVLATGFDGPSVRAGTHVRVQLPDAVSREALETYEATVVHDDTERDLAFLRIVSRAGGLPLGEARFTAIPLARGVAIAPGTVLTTLGYPFGVRILTVLTGPLTGRRQEGDAVEWITVDAPFNPGNSGGSLVDEACRLVGVPTQVFRGGLNPVSMARPVDERVEAFVAEGVRRAEADAIAWRAPTDLSAPTRSTPKPPVRGGRRGGRGARR